MRPPNLRPRAEQALIKAFLHARQIEPDRNGRLEELRPLVVETIDDTNLEHALADIGEGDGQELLWTKREDGSARPPSIHSIFSSCGAALNNFGPWRLAPESLHLLGETGFSQLRFESKLPIFGAGRAPNLDVLLYDDDERVIAVESKLCEHLTPGKQAKFRDAYDRVGPTSQASWAALYELLKVAPERFCYLDVGQLVRHYFGLAKQTSAGFTHEGKRPTLLYLYWEPNDADEQIACLRHREEVEDFIQLVSDPGIPFVALTHRQLWTSWATQEDQPPWLPKHLSLLQERYGVAVG